MSEMPYDTNCDGITDVTTLDQDGNGYAEVTAYDTDQNGVYETVTYDVEQDGRADVNLHDTDQNGQLEQIDVDGNRDGIIDQSFFDYDGDQVIDNPPAGMADPSMPTAPVTEPSYPGGPMVSVDPDVYDLPDSPFVNDPTPNDRHTDSDGGGTPDIIDASPGSPFYD